MPSLINDFLQNLKQESIIKDICKWSMKPNEFSTNKKYFFKTKLFWIYKEYCTKLSAVTKIQENYGKSGHI